MLIWYRRADAGSDSSTRQSFQVHVLFQGEFRSVHLALSDVSDFVMYVSITSWRVLLLYQ